MKFEDFLSRINAEKYLFLDELKEIGEEDNSPKITLVPCFTRPTTQEDIDDMQDFPESVRKITENCHAIEPDYSTKYEIVFEDAVAYCVRNESYDDGDERTMHLTGKINVTEDSAFLDYVKYTTFADQIKSFRHYEIRCLNQIIDVASFNEPIVDMITKK